jgi:ABC-type sugar transport system permease subunit
MDKATYPVTFSVEYPERPLDRLSTLFRVFFAIPIVIVLASVSGATWRWTVDDRMADAGNDGFRPGEPG